MADVIPGGSVVYQRIVTVLDELEMVEADGDKIRRWRVGGHDHPPDQSVVGGGELEIGGKQGGEARGDDGVEKVVGEPEGVEIEGVGEVVAD